MDSLFHLTLGATMFVVNDTTEIAYKEEVNASWVSALGFWFRLRFRMVSWTSRGL